MICKVKYYDASLNAYAGVQYTYKTDLALEPYTKVLAPVRGRNGIEMKKALVTEVDLPESTIYPAWADRVQWIKEYDNG